MASKQVHTSAWDVPSGNLQQQYDSINILLETYLGRSIGEYQFVLHTVRIEYPLCRVLRGSQVV
jgi:hypothetical protein